MKDTLDVWPALPLLLQVESQTFLISGLGNIIAFLEHRNRICKTNLPDFSSSQLEEILAAMQEPFPDLMDLQLGAHDCTVPVIPGLFLGGFAPRLRTPRLDRFPFPRYRSCFCLPLSDSLSGGQKQLGTSSIFAFISSLILARGISHPRRWSLAFPYWPLSKHFVLNSNPLDHILTGTIDIHFRQQAQHALTSLLLPG